MRCCVHDIFVEETIPALESISIQHKNTGAKICDVVKTRQFKITGELFHQIN